MGTTTETTGTETTGTETTGTETTGSEAAGAATDGTQVPPAPEPSAQMRALERLVGTWQVTGGATGTVRYEPMTGGHFLLQHVELEQYGQSTTGLEVIGHLQPFGGERSDDVYARYYDDAGNTLDYVYELVGDTLRIWGGERGSPAYFEGTFSADGTVVDGAWVYPGGGGYPSTMTRTA